MATSALISLANASVRFSVAGGGTVTDPETGNVAPTTTVLLYKAFLKAVNVDPVVYPGIDVTAVVYEGYAIDPMELDPKVGMGTTGELEFGTGAAVKFEVLRARMGYGDLGTLGERLTGTLGTKITLLAQAF